MIPRRRFLCISAAAVALPGVAQAETRWQGRALGADVSVTLRGPHGAALLRRIETELRQVERLFSLYDPRSLLSRLNRDGRLSDPPAAFRELLQIAGDMHRRTGGRFDPTVQPLWQALATGGALGPARAAIGWNRVSVTASGVRLGTGQALTLNGIAQGYATDRITNLLARAGLEQALVNIGEYRALGGPWRLAIAEPSGDEITRVPLKARAIATSSPAALRLGDKTHILDPVTGQKPRWATISVLAHSATIADSASTAFCLMSREAIRVMANASPEIETVHLLSPSGHYQRIG